MRGDGVKTISFTREARSLRFGVMRPTGKLRCGILGTGWMLGRYAEAFRMLDDAALVAVASRDAERARAAGEARGAARSCRL